MDLSTFMFGLVTGVGFSVVAVVLAVAMFKPKGKPGKLSTLKVPQGMSKAAPLLAVVFIASFLLLGQAAPTFAQTPVPLPTLNVPVATLFTQTNFWMDNLSPVMAIGIGASIAVGLLLFVAAIIKGVFRGLG